MSDPPPPVVPGHPHAHWEGDQAHGWTLCTCHMRKNHPGPTPLPFPPEDPPDDLLDRLADALFAVAATLRPDGEPAETAARLYDLAPILREVAERLRGST